MRTAYRIAKAKYAATMWNGAGAVRIAGRWHHAGIPVVYMSSTESLAALELLVHAVQNLGLAPDPLVLGRALIPDAVGIESVDATMLPTDWNDPQSPPAAVRNVGSEWLAAGRTAVLQVPSALSTSEPNYLLAPQHPDLQLIEFRDPVPYSLDPRFVLGARAGR